MSGIGGGTKFVGARPTGSVIPDTYTRISQIAPDHAQFPCSLAGGTTIDLFKPTDLTGIHYYIHAEIGGDDAIIYDDLISTQPGGGSGWYTIDSTTRLGGDAGKVGSSILWINWANNGTWGYRSFGSTDPWLGANIASNNTFGIVRMDGQDRYQVYKSQSAGKSPVDTSFHFEVGFIRRNWNHITNPVDRNLNVAGAWTDEDLTDITEDTAEIALIRYSNLGPGSAKYAWMRTYGEIFQGPLWIQQVTHRHCLVNLTDQQLYQYWIGDAGVDQFIMGWYARPKNVLNINTGVLNQDTGILNIG
jgi:hypothetical protein